MHHLSNNKYELLIAQSYAGALLPVTEITDLCNLLDNKLNLSNVAAAIIVADLHHYRMRHEEGMVKKALTRRDKKPFEFFLNIN